ncbi:MAG: DUF1566 domain-containing protein [Deltaproteobacteria bacterium]|nr:DUF1566 domain-containing protein [Deltaproteobacteria bacterium]
MIRCLILICGLLLLISTTSSVAGTLKNRGDGTVLDQTTGLIWQQGDSGRMPWLEAVRYCNQLDLANSRGWRLPFKDELKSLVAVIGSGDQLKRKAFPEVQAEVYWSLSREDQQPDQVWGVSFADGREYLFDRNNFNFPARCMIETPEAVYLPLLNKWKNAWSRQDVDAYLACYGKQFKPEGHLSRDEWAKQRRARISRPKSIALTISDIKVVSEQGNRAEVRFRQAYKASNYADQVMKVLTLGLERGELVIVGERTISKIK